jgi:hypothetical protein
VPQTLPEGQTNRYYQTNQSERYGYDNLNHLTVMDRGVLNDDNTAVEVLLNHPVLNSITAGPTPDIPIARNVKGRSGSAR